jgi:anti-sigma regulatory factor (Ser/Thr protein kinase)
MNSLMHSIAEFIVPSEIGNERLVVDNIAALAGKYLSGESLERLKTAVGEATLNAIEHGNQNRAELPVSIELLVSDIAIAVRISDEGGNQLIPEHTSPDLEKKLAGLETPRGWGLFLIKNMVDEVNISSDGVHHTLELLIYRNQN